MSRRAKGQPQLIARLGRRDNEVLTANKLKPLPKVATSEAEERAWKAKPKAIIAISSRLTAIKNGNHIRMMSKASEDGGQLGIITSLRFAGTDIGGTFA